MDISHGSTGSASLRVMTTSTQRATLCYMRTVTHREMRNSSGEILRAVAAGETVQVTNNGVVAAVIGPPPASTFAQLSASGSVRPASRDVAGLRDLKRTRTRRRSAELLADVRGER